MQNFLRKWHRWIGFPASLFLLFAAVTGILLAATEFFGEEEALRERTRELVSPVTVQTPDADLAVMLARARASVAVQAGSAPLDKIVWQFKGETPTITFFLGKPTGGEDRKVTVDARTGKVLRTEAYVDKPFLLRLHSGEVFGDGGLVLAMFWGLALILLTVSGIIIYWKMRRPNLTGIRRIFWLLTFGGFALAATNGRADSPFYTDDPEFSPGWEIKFGMTAEHNTGGNTWTAPVLDLNYAVVPNLRLNLTLAGRTLQPVGGPSVFGFADTEFKVKWRFVDADTNSWLPSIGIAPKGFFPTSDRDRGLGDGVYRAQLPLQFGKTIGRFYNWGEVGYQMAFDKKASDVAYYGIGTLYSFNSHFALGTELFGYTPIDDRQNHQWITSLGAVYTFNEHWALKASISRTLRDESRGGPNPSGVFYLVWNF